MKNICIFCSSSNAIPETFKTNANNLGEQLASTGHFRLVYGGGRVGLMGILGNAFKRYGAEKIGIIPEKLITTEIAADDDTQQIITQTMHERKEKLSQLGDVFVILPGGIGTLDEFFEMLTLKQLGYIGSKPIVVLNWNGFFDALLQQMKILETSNFTNFSSDCFTVFNTNEELLQFLS